MCAKTFPVYHPRAGQPTNFRESILDGTKLHTLRGSANGRKTGEIVSLREWKTKPYASKQVEFAQCEIMIDRITIEEATVANFEIANLAKCDGFDCPIDFQHWFTKGKDEPITFDGVVIWFRCVKATSGQESPIVDFVN